MADKQLACAACEPKGICGGKGLLTLKEGAWAKNPLAIQVLGICSALAVTNRLGSCHCAFSRFKAKNEIQPCPEML